MMAQKAVLTAGERMVDASGATVATKRAIAAGVLNSRIRPEHLRTLTKIECVMPPLMLLVIILTST